MIHLGITSDYKFWIAALLTLAIFSFLYKDNPIFKLAEHLFAGVASAYVLCTQWDKVVIPNLIDPALSRNTPAAERWLLLIPFALCACMILRVVPKWGWMSRWALAFIIGFYAGTNIPLYLETNVIKQIESTWEHAILAEGETALEAAARTGENVIFILGVLSVLTLFYFSIPHTGKVGRPVGWISTLGRYFMMVAFGATFANAVMGRVSVLLGSLILLLRDWLEMIA